MLLSYHVNTQNVYRRMRFYGEEICIWNDRKEVRQNFFYLLQSRMLIGNLFQQFYNMVDSIVVGCFVGANALAAVGATGP